MMKFLQGLPRMNALDWVGDIHNVYLEANSHKNFQSHRIFRPS